MKDGDATGRQDPVSYPDLHDAVAQSCARRRLVDECHRRGAGAVGIEHLPMMGIRLFGTRV